MTKRDLLRMYTPILNIGANGHYELDKYTQFKLTFIGKNSGDYGWNWDAYIVCDTINGETFILMEGFRNTLSSSNNEYINQLKWFLKMCDSSVIFKYEREL